MKTIRRFRWVAASAALCLVASLMIGCSVNPATGQRQLVLMSESQEVAMGREAHQQIMGQMGVYEDAEIQEYVNALGQELAALSERPHLPWTFTVLDDPVVNAFALPGGFIYVTRGIMTHLNTEAELVSILGHEVGHVTGRHGVERMSKTQLLGLGLGIGMVVSPELRQFGDLAQQGLGLLFLKYSRDDEREADSLGLRYTVAGNWDARDMPEVFGVLKAVGDAAGSERLPGWLSTHPDPDARQERIGGMLAELNRDFDGSKRNRETFLAEIDGMIFGANPREGFFEDGDFLHPEMEFRLAFPDGWQTRNQRQSVVGISQKQDAIVGLTLEQDADPAAAARTFLSQEGIRGGRVQTGRIHGNNAAVADFEVPRDQQSSLRGRVAFVRFGENTFRLLGYTTENLWNDHRGRIGGFIESFDRLRDRRALNVQPARVDLVAPRRALDLNGFQQQFPSSVPIETVGLINHIGLNGQAFSAGQGAKRVVGGLGR